MKEIEVKAKVNNLDDLILNIKNLGCELSESIIQEDKIFLPIGVKIKESLKGKIILRIRKSNSKIILTLKKQLENELDNIEIEVVVDDFSKMEDILKYMNYHVVVEVKKKRRKAKYNDLEICVDEVEGLGSFVEVEKMSESGDSSKIQEELFQFLESLGIKREDRVFQGYDTLVYLKNNKQ